MVSTQEQSNQSDAPGANSDFTTDHESVASSVEDAVTESTFEESAAGHEQAAEAYLTRDQSADESDASVSDDEGRENAARSDLAPVPPDTGDEDLSEDGSEDDDEQRIVEVSLKGKRVLLIEDDREFAAGITENLKDLEVGEILYASNGETGLSFMADPETFPDVILLELALIGMDGIQFLAQLRANPSKRLQKLPAVVITMLDSPSIYRRAANQKVGAFLRKPVSVNALKDGLQAALRGDIVEKPFSQPKSWLDDVDEQELRAKREANITKASAKAQKQGFLVRVLNALIPWSGKA